MPSCRRCSCSVFILSIKKWIHYLGRSSYLQMTWNRRSTGTGTSRGYWYTGLHRRYLGFPHTRQYLRIENREANQKWNGSRRIGENTSAYLSLLYKVEHRAKPKYLVYIYFFTHKSPRSTEDRLCAKSEIHAEKWWSDFQLFFWINYTEITLVLPWSLPVYLCWVTRGI